MRCFIRKKSDISAIETIGMKNICRFFRWLGLGLISAFVFWPAASNGQISDQIRELIDQSHAENAFWAVQVRDSTGNLLENLNGDKLIRPASNLKLISSGAFLDKLGPDYRYRTILYGRGRQEGDKWMGDLIIRGSGDPTIDGNFSDGDPMFLFQKWYEKLYDLGIRSIEGNIIGYEGLFDDVPYPNGWDWDDLSFYYAPEINALSFNSNVVDLEVTANGAVGSTPRIQWYPFNTPYVEFINEQSVTPRGTRFQESYRRVLGTNTIILKSTLPQGYYETEPLSVLEPSMYFIDTFSRYLEKGDIRVNGRLLVDRDYYGWNAGGLRILDIHISEPLHKIIEWSNRESDNFYTEMLLKTMASEVYNVQGTTDLGLRVMKEFMHEMDFDTLSVSVSDASGMASSTLLKASDLNRYLLRVQEKDYFPHLLHSLPVGGVNGTLSYRFRNSPVREQFYGKTGYLSGVRALSGYLDSGSGRRLAVTIVTNNYTARTAHVDYVHERILEYIYSEY